MNDSQLDSMRTVSWVSYLLHLIVAVGAVFPLSLIHISEPTRPY